MKGTPKHDGSGRGVRANKGRGGCEETEPVGKGRVANGRPAAGRGRATGRGRLAGRRG